MPISVSDMPTTGSLPATAWHVCLSPAIAYKASDVDAETHEGKAWYGKFNLDFLLRAGLFIITENTL